MFSITYATDCELAENPWLCIYDKYEEIFRESIEKMSGTNMRDVFQSPEIRDEDFQSAMIAIKKLKEEKDEMIENLMKSCVEMCPPKERFSLFFLPVPFDFIIVTNHSPKIGTFILYGAGKEISEEDLRMFLPHEYAHVVRLQSVLLPQGIDSPHKMTLGELAIFEGLGVAFSMVFNDDISDEKIPEYAGLTSLELWERRAELMQEFVEIKNTKFSELTPEMIQKYYGEGRGIYIVGTILIFELISNGFSICELNRMSAGEIIRKTLSKNF